MTLKQGSKERVMMCYIMEVTRTIVNLAITTWVLYQLQNRALRVCLDVHHYVSIIVLHQEAGIVNLKVRRSCKVKKYMYKQQQNKNLVVKPAYQTSKWENI